MDQVGKLAHVRSLLRQAEARAGLVATQDRGWQTPATLQEVLPVLPPGLVQVSGSFSILLSIASHLSQQDGWVAFVGLPWIGWGSGGLHGLNFNRVAHIPDTHGRDKEIMISLLDGFDLVVVGETTLTTREERAIGKRARDRGASLLSDSWRTASVRLHVTHSGPRGYSRGVGHLVSTACSVRRDGHTVGCLVTQEGLTSERRLAVVP